MLLFLCFVSCNNDESCCFFVSIVNIVLISAAGDVLLSWVSMQLLTYVVKRKGDLYFDHDVGLCVNSETAPYFLSISLVSALFLIPLFVIHPLSSFFSFF